MIQQARGKALFYDDGTLTQEVLSQLRVILISMIFAAVWSTITTGSAFTGYIKALGASDFMLSVLMAMPFAVRVTQLLASYLLERTRARMPLFIVLGLISRLLWVPIALVPFLVPMSQPLVRLWSILLLYTLAASSGVFIDAAYLSLAADVVPLRIRGRYFSLRSRLFMAAGIVTGLVTGVLLDNLHGGDGLLGYITCFIIAGIFGALDIVCYMTTKFPPMEDSDPPGAKKSSMPAMIGQVLRDRPFVRLVGYWTLWALCANLMAPFFNVYMLEYIRMSFLEIILFATIPYNLMSVIMLPRWGRMMDTYGYKPVIYICTFLVALTPFMWLFCGPRSFVGVVLAQMVGGSFFPAIDLSGQNTIMNASPARNRSMFIAVYMVTTQLLGIAISYVLGGFLLDNVFTPLSNTVSAAGASFFGFPITQYHFLLVLCGILRILCAQIALRSNRIEEGTPVREVLAKAALTLRRGTFRQIRRLRAQVMRKRARRRLSDKR